MKLIYCRGGDKDAPKIARWAQMEYGTRYDYKPYATVYMLDGGADSVKWARYLEVVKEVAPKMALTPDFFSTVDKHTLWAQIDALRALGVEHVAVCPKFMGAVKDIPIDCIVAISVPTSYAGFLPLSHEVYGRKLHFLGGSPDQHAHLIQQYVDAEIVSIDLNVIGRKAGLGQFWARSGGWVDVRKFASRNHYPTWALAALSGRNVRRYLAAPAINYRRRRVQRAMYSSLLFDELTG